jgi:hypothetical protein
MKVATGETTRFKGGDPVNTLLTHTNEVSPEMFGELTPETSRRDLAERVPLMATPAAVAAGVGVTVAAFGVGFAVEETADG